MKGLDGSTAEGPWDGELAEPRQTSVSPLERRAWAKRCCHSTIAHAL